MSDLTPLSAVTSADPYPYYERLIRERPFYRDKTLGMWVASSAQAVQEILTCDSLRVRPAAEPVPRALQGASTGDTFGRLVRMTDGPQHGALKRFAAGALARLQTPEIAEISARCARLLTQTAPANNAERLQAYMFALPVMVVASLLGLPEDSCAVAWTAEFARAIAPGCTEDDLRRGNLATDALQASLRALFTMSAAPGSLLSNLRNEGRRLGISDDAILANAIGFLFQSYDATAGLIGNTLVALAREGGAASAIHTFVAEVARHDSPVQNTRRFAASDTPLQGSIVRAEETILVVVGAANRDPGLNRDPQRFDPEREDRRSYTFGAGAHACPGERLAVTIATAGVIRLLEAGTVPTALKVSSYRRAPNVRIPNFADPSFT